MDENFVEEVLNELLPAFELLETQSKAVLHFLQDIGIATDERLAPYIEQARKSSNVRWLAIHVRMKALLISAIEKSEKQREEEIRKMQEETGETQHEEKSTARRETKSESSGQKPVQDDEQKNAPEHPSKKATTSKDDSTAVQKRDQASEKPVGEEEQKDAA